MKLIKNTKFILIFLLLFTAAAVLTLTACSKVTDIYVTTQNAPRLTYVVGQSLDLSSGVLTVDVDGKETSVPMDSEEVTVSGYDSGKLGEQILTVQYKELSTTITVTVVPRIVAESYESAYFIGDSFNAKAGKLKVAADDGKTSYVNMNDSKVSVISFDSSKAGSVNVTVRYSAQDTSYDCTFTVTVYDFDKVEFTAPSVKTYKSHDTVLDISDGFFTVESSDGKLKKHIPLSADMVKVGLDTSSATMENRVDPKTHNVRVEYLGHSFEYPVSILFSGVSVVKYYAENVLADKDLSEELTPEQSAAVLDAVTEYTKLQGSEKALISDEQKALVARAGAIAVSSLFNEELEKYSGTFIADGDMNLYLVSSSYERTSEDIVGMMDDESKLNVYADLLRFIEKEFADVVISADITAADYVKIYSESTEDALFGTVKHLVDTFALIKDIPADWSIEDLKAHGDGIFDAAMEIYNAKYYKDGKGAYYTDIFSPWREDNDVFEIIYTYFLYAVEDSKDFMLTYLFGSMPMPGLLEDWYGEWSLCIIYENDFSTYPTKLADVTPFMYHYFSAMQICKEIRASEDKLLTDIYDLFNIDNINTVYMKTAASGYLYHVRGMVDSDAFLELWGSYYTVLEKYYSGELDAEEHKAELKAMAESLQALDPSELFGFLSSMHLLYNGNKGKELVLDLSGDAKGVFAYLLKEYYVPYVDESARDLAEELLLAMENYALVGYKTDAKESFVSAMAKIVGDYKLLSEDARASFNEYFGTAYEGYLSIYGLITETKTVTLTESEARLLDELLIEIDKYYTVYDYMTGLSNISTDLYGLLYALFAKVDSLYTDLISSVGEDSLALLLTEEYEIIGGTYTLDKAFFTIDGVTTRFMAEKSVEVVDDKGRRVYVTVWDLFNNYGIRESFAIISDLLYYYYYPEDIELDTEYVEEARASVESLSDFGYKLLSFFGVEDAYNGALERYAEENP